MVEEVELELVALLLQFLKYHYYFPSLTTIE